MKYEVGQKVETPLGVGVVKGIRHYQEPIYQIKFMDSNFKVLDFEENELKPYKTPHERLLEMGYELNDTQDYLLYYDGNRLTISIHKKTKVWVAYLGVDGLVEVGLKLTKIMADYLEWLEEEKWMKK